MTASPASLAPGEKLVHRVCPFCEATCGLTVKLRDGKVVGVRGNDADVFSAGYICPKGAALKDLHEDPDRLRTPLIKRNGEFVEATWEEAFAEIERRLMPILAEHGRDSLAVVLGNPSVHKLGLISYFPRLLKAAGTRNFFSASTTDQMPKQLSSGLMFGHWLSIPVPDIDRTDYLLVIGANPAVSNGSLWTVPDFRGRAKALRARGGKLVTVDPRRTETADMADRHLFIRPGGDAFLLLGVVHTLYAENLVKLGAKAEHLAGVEELRAAVAPFAPEAVAERCGIAAEEIRTLAREFAAAPRAAAYCRLGACTQAYGTMVNWLVDALNALTGNLDREGGIFFPKAAAFAANTAGKPGAGRGVSTGRRTSRVAKAPEVFGEFPIGCLPEEIETEGPGRVRATITVAANPVLSAPNSGRMAAALDRLEFMVSMDIYLGETSRHADVILPGRSPLEDAHYDAAFNQFGWRNTARYSPVAVEADPAHLPEWRQLLTLTAILRGEGAGADLDALDDRLVEEDVRAVAGPQADAVMQVVAKWKGPDRLLDLALRAGPYGDLFGLKPDGINLDKVIAQPDGVDFGPLQPRIPEVLRTPSGKVELAPPSLIADLDRARADLARPANPLVIVGRRQVRSNNSWMHNLPILAKGSFRCTAMVHPVDAARLGLTAGGKARILAGNKAIEAQVELSDDMMPGVVSLPHGWGHDLPGTRLRVAAERPGANLNALLDETARDPLSGNAVLSGVPVSMAPA